MSDPRFGDDPRTVWLNETGPDRRMRLIDGFWFQDRQGKRWDAPGGAIVNGASIPRPLWALVGSPYTGEYRRASIVHDIACVEAGGNDALRRAADKMFFVACRAGGCSRWDAIVLYVGVRIGAWFSGLDLAGSQRPVKLRQDAVDRRVEEDFATVAEIVLAQGEIDDPELVEKRTDAALESVAAARLMLVP